MSYNSITDKVVGEKKNNKTTNHKTLLISESKAEFLCD